MVFTVNSPLRMAWAEPAQCIKRTVTEYRKGEKHAKFKKK